MSKQGNFYKDELDMITNAMSRECAPQQTKTGFWQGMNTRRDEMIIEFRAIQKQLCELLASGNSDTSTISEYLDICEAIGE